MLLASLHAPKKDSREPKPVAVGEIFYRLATGLSVSSSKDAVRDILAPIQMDLGMLGGEETVHLFLKALLCDFILIMVVVDSDFTNAFNDTVWDKFLMAIFKHKSPRQLWKLAH